MAKAIRPTFSQRWEKLKLRSLVCSESVFLASLISFAISFLIVLSAIFFVASFKLSRKVVNSALTMFSICCRSCSVFSFIC
jgi:hypothetical protein